MDRHFGEHKLVFHVPTFLRKSFLDAIAASCALLFCFLTTLGSVSWAAERIRIAYPSSLTAVQVWVAKKHGFFEKNSLDAELLVVGTEIALMSQIAGELDYTIFGTSVPTAVINGAPLKVVMWLYDRLDYVLVALPEYKTVESLKGKAIGISSYGASTHDAVRAIFRAHGINVDKEASVIPMGRAATRFQAILAKKIAATVFPSPRDFFAEQKGLVLLGDVRDKLDWPMTGVTVTHRKLTGNPGQVGRVIKSLLEATDFYKDSKQESIDLIQGWLNLPRLVAEKSYFKSLAYVSYNGKTRDKAVLNLIDAAKRDLKKSSDYPASMFVDYSLLEEVTSGKK